MQGKKRAKKSERSQFRCFVGPLLLQPVTSRQYGRELQKLAMQTRAPPPAVAHEMSWSCTFQHVTHNQRLSVSAYYSLPSIA
eukprot:1140566-Pelagomonas_calceolata.AAC.2